METIANDLEKLKINNQLRTIPDIEQKFDGKVVIDGVEYVNFASNDYLGISTKSELIEEFKSSNKSLFSSASARLLTGSSIEYKQLESTVAKLFNKEAALIFNTGYQANLGIISALVKKGDVIFSDKLNHASIIDGMRLSEGNFYRYKHLNYEHLQNLLEEKRHQYKRAIIVSESIFSMDGDIADIEKLVELKNKYNCLLLIDEAHAFFTYGDSNAGLSYNKDVDIITATFGKAVGSFGAFCVSSQTIISYLINNARSFIFSTSIPPVNIAWSNWLLTEKFYFMNQQKSKLHELTKSIHTYLKQQNLKIPSQTHIIPILIGSNEKTLKVSEKLKAMGYYIPAIRPPTVPQGTSRLRISLTSDIRFNEFCDAMNIISTYNKNND